MKFRNIGDVLLVTPLIKNLKQNFPEAIIDVAVNKGCEDMVTLNPNINEVIVYNRASIKKLSLLKRILGELKFAFGIRNRDYDLVINTTEGDRGAQLAFLSKAKIKVGYKVKKNRFLKNVFDFILPPQWFRHTIETNLDALRVLNIPINEKKVEIYNSNNDKNFVDNILKENKVESKNYIHIHPVSRWMFKCINDDIMAKIIDYCEENLKLKVVLTAAPVIHEEERINNILLKTKSNPINLSGKLTLKQTSYLNKNALCFIGVDTAIMHISAANDIPVVAFFGPSGTDHWGPWDNDLMESEYKFRSGFQKMGKHRVISESRDCQPCGKDGCNGTKTSDCLMNLNLDFIKKNINEMINEIKYMHSNI